LESHLLQGGYSFVAYFGDLLMPPAVLGVPYDLHPCERPWRSRLVAWVTSKAGHPGAAPAGIVAIPRATGMVFANPETILASGALHLTIRYFLAAFRCSTIACGLFRFSACSTPILACMMKSRPSATSIKQCTAICHSRRSCVASGSSWIRPRRCEPSRAPYTFDGRGPHEAKGNAMKAPANLAEKFTTFSDRFSPRTVATYSNNDIMVAKSEGPFHWHKQDDTDDFSCAGG